MKKVHLLEEATMLVGLLQVIRGMYPSGEPVYLYVYTYVRTYYKSLVKTKRKPNTISTA